jgi:hypothetical protein
MKKVDPNTINQITITKFSSLRPERPSLEDALIMFNEQIIFTLLTESKRREIEYYVERLSTYYRDDLNGRKIVCAFTEQSIQIYLEPSHTDMLTETKNKELQIRSKQREKQSNYYENNRAKWNEYQREYKKKRYAEDPEYKKKTLDTQKEYHKRKKLLK